MNITDFVRQEITDIESRTDISEEQKISRITTYACATCAGIAVQPLPFADILILTPIQAFFASRIAAIRGVPVSESDASHWIRELIGIVGLGIVAQQIALGVWKLVTFGLGGFLTIPLVFALTYAVMSVADIYFSAKSRNETLTKDQLKSVWEKAFKQGKRRASTESHVVNPRARS